jgi:hypothetical protein
VKLRNGNVVNKLSGKLKKKELVKKKRKLD